MNITVEQLLEIPFSSHTLEDKILIVSEGKPRPLFQFSVVTASDAEQNMIVQTSFLEPAIYDSVPWLTGCLSESCFYCWPCLLFPSSDSKWSVTDPAFLTASMSQHEKTAEHIQATLNFKMFSLEHLMVKNETVDNEQVNRMVMRNRKIVKILIDALCIPGVVSPHQPSKKYFCHSEVVLENCVKALTLLKHCNIRCKSEIDESINMIKTSPLLLKDLVAVVINMLKTDIKKDIQNSTYASLILSDHSTVLAKSQISVIVRYTKIGKVHERFIGFINVLSDKSATAIYSLISSLVDEFGLSDKLLSYSLDGGVVEPSELHDLLSMMEKFHPQSFFVPCYFHGLYYILQQSLSSCKEFRHFFKMLSGMEVYVNQCTKQLGLNCIFQFLGKSTLCSEAPILKIIRMCRNSFIRFLNFIIQASSFLSNSREDYIKARAMLMYLQEFRTVFLFNCLTPLYDHIMCLDEDLRNSWPEKAFESETVSAITLNLLDEKIKSENHFYSALHELKSTSGNVQKPVPFKHLSTKVREQNVCLKLCVSIIEHLVREITLRFKDLNKLEFCSVINRNNHGTQKVMNLMKYCPQILKALGPNFCEERFKNEMDVQHKSGKIFCEYSAYELLDRFSDPSLKCALKCTHKLIEFTLTLPIFPPVQDGYSSTFHKIKRFFFSSDSMVAPEDVSLLYVESDLLQDLRTKVFFHDEIIENLSVFTKSIELMYRK